MRYNAKINSYKKFYKCIISNYISSLAEMLNEAIILRPRPRPRPRPGLRGQDRGRGQGYEVKAEAKANFSKSRPKPRPSKLTNKKYQMMMDNENIQLNFISLY